MRIKISFILALVFTASSCVNTTSNNESESDHGIVAFEDGDLMTAVSVDPLGNKLTYPTGDAAITSQVKVWEPGFSSPWHYHPYTGVAYVLQGELTENYDTETSLEDSSSEKSATLTQSYKAGDKAFLGVSNTWHFSQNLGDEDLIFMVTWLAEEGEAIAVLEEK